MYHKMKLFKFLDWSFSHTLIQKQIFKSPKICIYLNVLISDIKLVCVYK
jgi:hypothetical protein